MTVLADFLMCTYRSNVTKIMRLSKEKRSFPFADVTMIPQSLLNYAPWTSVANLAERICLHLRIHLPLTIIGQNISSTLTLEHNSQLGFCLLCSCFQSYL